MLRKYKKVYLDIREKITDGTFKSGEFLKSEMELAKSYSYSKDTIRRALSMLEMDGYIQKIKGKNSLVLEYGRFKNSLSNLQTSEELNRIEKIDIKTNLISLYVVQGENEIMKIFGVDDKVDFYKAIRNRVLDGEALEYEVAYFDRRIVRFLNKEIAQSSIYNYLENELQLKISHSRREIKFRNATEEEKKYMDLGKYNMVVAIENRTYLSNGTLFQYGVTSYKPDKFIFSTVAKR
ncbi:UTRA domain-containing protein [Leptotrichia sp. oral taxon 847]|uniref:UTRA domain-containing protein n=1 Tax=Leptotrichia sp. oral taxon 847 TaxID=1785996 RepID=UPI0007682B5A|nr:UTRA domain-containing protein [Leptotrichia sp. oral taxon 847]AMD95774.1 GntR family transcriptional regulator [Leptotrichia sp. oral taxon 847]